MTAARKAALEVKQRILAAPAPSTEVQDAIAAGTTPFPDCLKQQLERRNINELIFNPAEQILNDSLVLGYERRGSHLGAGASDVKRNGRR
jgi:hypothetical protein